MRRFICALLAFGAFCFASAQSPEAIREIISKNPRFALAAVSTYDNVEIGDIAAAPKGYKPFYFSMIGRHGSRYETRDEKFTKWLEVYDKAAELGILTDLGKRVHQTLTDAVTEQRGKGGELSPLGHRQLQAIGRRAYNNFKTIFDSGSIEGKSSTKMRCVFSMVSFVDGLKEGNPKISAELEARELYMPMLRPMTAESTVAADMFKASRRNRDYGAWVARIEEWANRQDMSLCINKLVTNPALLVEKCGAGSHFLLAYYTHHLLLFAENFERGGAHFIDEIFTVEEQYAFHYYHTVAWMQWTAGYGNPISDATASYIRVLVDDVVKKIDEAIEGENPNVANLRFTHDSYLLPLLGVFGCENARLQYNDDWDKAVDSAPISKVIPMGANLQLVLYRNKRGEVLLRALLNERDVRLPIECESAPFYPWSKVREVVCKNMAELERRHDAYAKEHFTKNN